MRTSVELITPEVAAEYLANNYESNRPVRKTYVSTLAQSMLDGEFVSMNGQTIVLGADDGKLYDGQHRLMAIVQSGVAQEMLVARVDGGIGTYMTLDAGTPRRVADFIAEPRKNALSAAAKVMLCLEEGDCTIASVLYGKLSGSRVSPSRIKVLDFYNANKERVCSHASEARRMHDSIGCGSVVSVVAFIDLVAMCQRDGELAKFCAAVREPVPTNPTIVSLKNAMMRKHLTYSKRETPRDWQLGLLLDAYEHYRKHDGAIRLSNGATRIKAYDALLAESRELRAVGLAPELEVISWL